jgi:hypothetical protein
MRSFPLLSISNLLILLTEHSTQRESLNNREVMGEDKS